MSTSQQNPGPCAPSCATILGCAGLFEMPIGDLPTALKFTFSGGCVDGLIIATSPVGPWYEVNGSSETWLTWNSVNYLTHADDPSYLSLPTCLEDLSLIPRISLRVTLFNEGPNAGKCRTVWRLEFEKGGALDFFTPVGDTAIFVPGEGPTFVLNPFYASYPYDSGILADHIPWTGVAAIIEECMNCTLCTYTWVGTQQVWTCSGSPSGTVIVTEF